MTTEEHYDRCYGLNCPCYKEGIEWGKREERKGNKYNISYPVAWTVCVLLWVFLIITLFLLYLSR